MDLNKVTLSQPQQRKWNINALVFTIPLITLYLGILSGTISGEGHILSLKDFIPNSTFLGGAIVYIQSIIIDYGKKMGV